MMMVMMLTNGETLHAFDHVLLFLSLHPRQKVATMLIVILTSANSQKRSTIYMIEGSQKYIRMVHAFSYASLTFEPSSSFLVNNDNVYLLYHMMITIILYHMMTSLISTFWNRHNAYMVVLLGRCNDGDDVSPPYLPTNLPTYLRPSKPTNLPTYKHPYLPNLCYTQDYQLSYLYLAQPTLVIKIGLVAPPRDDDDGDDDDEEERWKRA